MPDSKTKRPPVAVRPDRIALSQKLLVIIAGPDTYHIDLDQFYDLVPWPVLVSAYHAHQQRRDPSVKQRIDETYGL